MKGAKQIVERADIEAEAGPAVLAVGLEALVELDLRGAQVRGVARGIAPHRHQRVRLLGAGGQDAARPVVLERAPDEVHAVGEQRRGERVAGQAACSARPSKRKCSTRRAVDAAAGRGAQRGVHRAGTAGRGSPTL